MASALWRCLMANLFSLSLIADRWWQKPTSFLHDELAGRVQYFRDNAPVIPPAADAYPLSDGLTSLGLSDWRNSFQSGFIDVPGYTGTVFSTLRPGVPVSIATSAFVTAPTAPVPLPSALLPLLLGLLVLLPRGLKAALATR